MAHIDWSKQRSAIKEYLKDEIDRAHYERGVSLLMIGTTMSPCCFVSFVLILCKCLTSKNYLFDLKLSLTALAFSLAFLILAWIKAAQHTQEVANAITQLESRNS